MIYVDNASTTPIDPAVLEAMMPYLKEQFGNPGTLYGLGRSAKKAIEHARQQVADFIGAEPQQIIFTSGGTEANNMVFASLWDFLKKSGKTHVITAHNEHDSVLKSVQKMCIKHDFYSTLVGVDERGCVNPKDVRTAINEDTGLVSIMYMNNETGSENDVEEIAAICKEKNILFHTDCVQAAGCSELNVNKIGCDFLTISSHKIHGAKGVGALFVKDLSLTDPMILGGATQEFGYRGGTENVAGIVGFGMACEIMSRQIHDIDVHTSVLKQLFYNDLESALKTYSLDGILHINGDIIIKHGKILNIRFDNIDGETLLLLLDQKGVCVSAGSACRSHESNPSHVLLAMGVSPDDARNSIRVSFSKMNTEDEVKQAAYTVADCVRMLYV